MKPEIAIVIIATVSIVIFILEKTKSARILANIDRNPANMEKIVKKLGTFYRKMNIEEFPDLFEMALKIPENQKFNKYILAKVFNIDENRLLCLTTCTDKDFVVGKYGGKRDVQNIFKFNFIIKKNIQKAQYEFYSSVFDDLNEKNLKMDFKDELIGYLKK